MDRTAVKYSDHFATVMSAMTGRGLLLGSYDAAGKANIMTIGWGTIGSLWGVATWTVLIHPGRYTCQCIEHTGCFSVNVPTDRAALACAVFGTMSERDDEVFDQAGLTIEKGSHVLAPTVAECPIIYECQVVHSGDLLPEKLATDIISGAYVDGNSHRMYFGKILSVRAADNAAELLR